MAQSAIRLLTDDALQRQFAAAARRVGGRRVTADPEIVPVYESYYEEIARPAPRG